MRAQSAVLAAVIVILASPAAAAPPETSAPAGRIKVASGAAFIVRGTEILPAEIGVPVYQSDKVRTGTDGRIGITLRDDTRFSLGPGSEVHLDRFAYAPAEGRLQLALNVVRGMAAYVSGRIAKLAPDAVRLETPGAIVGVRGTTIAVSASPR